MTQRQAAIAALARLAATRRTPVPGPGLRERACKGAARFLLAVAAGLDPLMEATFRECVNGERRERRTILLSSHLLAEAEALVDRVTIIRDGRRQRLARSPRCGA